MNIFILSSTDIEKAVNLGKAIHQNIEGVNVHIIADLFDEDSAFNKIKSFEASGPSIFIDEYCEVKKEILILLPLQNKNIRLDLKVNDNIGLAPAIILNKETLEVISKDELFGLMWGKQDVLVKYEVETQEDCGNYYNFYDATTSFFLGNKIKYYVEKYGDPGDIDVISEHIENKYFLMSDSKFKLKIDPDCIYFKNAMKKDIDSLSVIGSNYMPQGRGLVIVPVENMSECFGVRFFAESIYSQTYSNFEILCIGKAEDVVDASKYILDGVRFKILDKEPDFAYINEVVRERKYDWYFIADVFSKYKPDTIQRFLSSGCMAGFGLCEAMDVETKNILGTPSIDPKTMFFRHSLFDGVGFFNPINKFGVLEMINRVSSLQFPGCVQIPYIFSKKMNIPLNFKIDAETNVRDIVISKMKEGYNVGPSFNGKSMLFNVPACLVKRSPELTTGEIDVDLMVIRTLNTKSRVLNMRAQLNKFNIKKFSFWQNTHKNSEEFLKLKETGLIVRGDYCYQCMEKECDHEQTSITDGQAANFYSMMKLFKSIEKSDLKDESLILICEDDILMYDNFVKQINIMLKKEEVVSSLSEPLLIRAGWGDMLEYRRDHYFENEEDYELREDFKRFSNPCFVINKHAIKYFLKKFKVYDRACDQWIHTEEGMNIKNLSIYPPLCKEMSHIGLVSSDMHPKASSYEWQYLMYIKTGNIEYYNESMRIKQEYDIFWGKHYEEQNNKEGLS